MRVIIRLTYFFILISHISSFAQSDIYSEGNKKFDNLAYMDAVKIYENVVKNGFQSASLYQRIGNAYYLNGKYKTALIWYKKLFKNYSNKKIDPLYYFRYSHALKSTGNQGEGDIWMQKFYSIKGTTNTHDINSLHIETNNLELVKLAINSKYSDFSPFVHNNILYFSSSRKQGNTSKKTDTWTNLPYYDILKVDITKKDTPPIIHNVGKGINTDYNETSAVISSNGNTIYFTRNVAHKREIQKFKLFKAVKENNRWSKAIQLPFTKNKYLYAHPAINKEGNKLYFATNLKGSYGLSDIYVVDILGNNKYSKPKNLGPKINTFGRDSYPYIDLDGNLFYASDGKPGMGGFDIFKATISDIDTTIYHLSSPINSNYDDFGYTIDNNSHEIYLASNRDNKYDIDNIYRLQKIKDIPAVIIECNFNIQGVITEIDTKKQLKNVTVLLLNLNNEIVLETSSNKIGFYKFNVKNCLENYLIRTHKEGFLATEKLVSFDNDKKTQQIEISMEPYYQPVNTGQDLGKTLKLNPIYFDLDESKIRWDAKIELEKIAQAMLIAYPTINIEIGAHTDSRASNQYNLVLSEKRAQTTMRYLISRGISPDRISGKGYGETKLLNNCSDGVKCSEKDHQKNRRTEFIILN